MDPDQAIPTLPLWVTIPALDPDPQKSGIVKPLTYTHQIVDQRWGRAFSGRHPCSCSIPGTHILTSNINPENIERTDDDCCGEADIPAPCHTHSVGMESMVKVR